MELKEIRNEIKMTQSEAADYLGISLRSYKSYENDLEKKNNLKYHYLCETLLKLNQIDEEHGVISIDFIKRKLNEVFNNYNVNFCYLFGSYAKGYAKDDSDVDLLVDIEITGLTYFGFVEEIREALNKKVDLIRLKDLKDNLDLLKDIMKDGIKIYG